MVPITSEEEEGGPCVLGNALGGGYPPIRQDRCRSIEGEKSQTEKMRIKIDEHGSELFRPVESGSIDT